MQNDLKPNAPDEFMKNFYTNGTGIPLTMNEIWKQPELANTLSIIRDHGHDGFYSGEVAERLAKYMAEHGGIITEEDLSKYEAVERPPVKGTYKGFEIVSMGPPSWRR